MSTAAASGRPAEDLQEDIRAKVLAAIARGERLEIAGSGSKRFYGRWVSGTPLPVAGHCGIVDYEPTELVLTARCGTPLADIETELARHGQMLAFEPPHFGPGATLGGAVACGLSGPRRPYAGSLRDFMLGVKLINGKGEILSFGGRVMKNVAGFDVSRLMAGALGTLGVLLEISIKVLPRPEQELTLCFELDADSALVHMNRWAGEGLPLSAASHEGGRLRVRLAGAEAGIEAARARLGGEMEPAGDSFWEDLREQRLGFFQVPGRLWRFSLPPASALPELSGEWLLDWGGALRWLRGGAAAEQVFAAAARQRGHATCFRGQREGTGPVFQPLPPALMKLHQRLKSAFDPAGVFNVGRMYREW